jgi:uncharacterized membrane protein
VRKLVPGLLALLAAVGFSLWAWSRLPAQVATHFDLQGNPNGWSSRLLAVALVPAIGVVMALLFTFLPRIDPKKENYRKFDSTWWTVANAALVFLALVHAAVLGKALGWAVDISRIVGLGVGALFILIGSLMTRIEPNWFMGIRTPWTLSSDTVWRKTHKFGGVAFVLAGVAVALTGLLENRWALYAAIGMAVIAGLGSVVYSYVVWRGEQKQVASSG